jgi:cytochrome c oxidase subunit 3
LASEHIATGVTLPPGQPATPNEHEHAHHPKLQHHFYSMEQQFEASILGMWVFLVTEVMFFGGLFMAYLVYRTMYPEAWVESSHMLNVPLGALNTTVLICSSLTMVLAVRSAQVGSRTGQLANLFLTIVLGSTFLVVKFFEYKEKFEHHLVPGPHFDPHHVVNGAIVPVNLPFGSQIFFSLYFVMTGIHAIHMVIGIILMAVMMVMAWRNKFSAAYYAPIEVSGLYWHFVDIVWIFLFPLLYLLGYHGGPGA